MPLTTPGISHHHRAVRRGWVPHRGATHNTVGAATVHGSVVQAGTITGQVNIGVPPPPSPQAVLDDAAERLADSLRKRWRSEEQRWRVQDPVPLPVRWQAAPCELTDHWVNVCRSPAGQGADLRVLSLAGRLDEVVDFYRRIPSRRLVVLGRAGSGKSILAVRFALDLLGPPGTSAGVVPVIFSLGSWNPVRPLGEWLVRRLERDHPGLAATTGSDGATLAAALVDNDRILPVLDGFDEIADGLHRPALEALNATTMPLLLTSRRMEYAAAVVRTDVLTSAAAVELADLSPADLEDYLPRTTRQAAEGATRWGPVLRHLREHPEHPASERLVQVLRTPLMVSLARTVYSDAPDHDPSVLLDDGRFGTPEAIEDHLVGSFIPTVYRDQPPVRRERIAYWLAYLAGHLERLGKRDLAWWQLGTEMSYLARMAVVGLVVGVVSTVLAGGVVLIATLYPERAFGDGLANGASLMVTFGLLHGIAPWVAARVAVGGALLRPSRVQVQIRGGIGRVRRNFVPGLVSGLGFGLAFGPLFGLVFGTTAAFSLRFAGGWENVLAFLAGWIAVGTAAGLVIGVVYGALTGLEVPVDIRSSVSPLGLLSADRRAVLVHLSVIAVLFGSGYGLVVADLRGGDTVTGLADGLIGGPEVVIGYGLSLTAWGRWVVLARIALPLAGRLPWSVGAFLEDAHRRGVLRQAGAVYQFRHARLQDHLSGRFQVAEAKACSRRGT